MRDDSTLFGKVKRYTQVGASAGKIATQFAGKRIMSGGYVSEEGAQNLRSALGGLKGPVMKAAQILATIPDALPEEFAKELVHLQSDAPAMGWAFVRRRMKKELGADWQSKFKSFDQEASFAASLGQVHMAKGLDDEQLVCKLQYPDMASAVEADLSQLKLVFNIYKRYDKAIDPSNVHTELAERLREELDYLREAKAMRLYHNIFDGEDCVHTPLPVDELTTTHLLTMNFLKGESLLTFVDDVSDLRNTVAMNMFKAWYIPLYNYGIIHGDPHPGNYTVREDGSINLLDFGCIRIFKPSFVGAIIQLYQAIRDDDQDKAVHAYETWGFDSPSKEVLEVLNRWARYLYTPLLEDKVRRIQDTDNGVYGANMASEIHGELRRLGGVTPPREFVLVDRAAIGLGSVFMRTKAELNWHRLFHELVDGFDPDVMRANQIKALEKVGLSNSEAI